MHRPDLRLLRAAAVVGAALLVVGCGTDFASPTAQPSGSGETQASATSAPQSGGTIYILTPWQHVDEVDPQRAYAGETIAFFGATIYRSLVSYTYSADPVEAGVLVPDMATDTGHVSTDAKTWTFTLRDGLTFQDGSPVTCEDVAYGTSRTFATDVISGGPKYQIQYLDIPTNDDGTSQYPGPYTATPDQQALYDKAVTCDGNTITFHLSQPVADFNYATTLGFNPVPKASDTGETYGDHPVSSGPYQIDSDTTGSGGRMVLVRNPYWDPASDPIRKAYPDRWEMEFGIDPKVIDQRLIESSGNDAYATGFSIEPENLTTVFKDTTTPDARFAGRAVSALDSSAHYYWINVQKVPNVKIRRAMAVALDRAAIRRNAGGAFAGGLADGMISPNLGDQYAPTGMWDSLLGQKIPEDGDPVYAKQLIQESGEPAPRLTWDYLSTPTRDKQGAIVKESLEKAGFQVNLNPIPPPTELSGAVIEAATAHEFGLTGWAPDWPNASTIIPPLTTPMGGWDLSRVCDPTCSAADDPEWLTKVNAALSEVDHATQARLWQNLNREAMREVFVIPTTFGRGQFLAGSKVKPVYQWAPWFSRPYGEMYVVQ